MLKSEYNLETGAPGYNLIRYKKIIPNIHNTSRNNRQFQYNNFGDIITRAGLYDNNTTVQEMNIANKGARKQSAFTAGR